MTLLAISVDEPEASRSFAGAYGIEFPLLTDKGGIVSRGYVGVDSNDLTVPGIVVIRRDGQIVFRQIAEAKDDRLTAAQLLATVDRTLGTTGGASAETGYAVLERLQLRFEIGSGANETSTDWRATAVASAAVMVPLHRYLLVGPSLRFEARDASLDLDLAVTLRAPILADAAALQLTALGGYTPLGASGWNAGVRAGAWVALDPRWALHLDAGGTVHSLEEAERPIDLTVTLGLSRLLQFR